MAETMPPRGFREGAGCRAAVREARYCMTILALSVLPAPDSPEIRMACRCSSIIMAENACTWGCSGDLPSTQVVRGQRSEVRDTVWVSAAIDFSQRNLDSAMLTILVHVSATQPLQRMHADASNCIMQNPVQHVSVCQAVHRLCQVSLQGNQPISNQSDRTCLAHGNKGWAAPLMGTKWTSTGEQRGWSRLAHGMSPLNAC